ncbi:MAG: type II secretion system protein GspN [Proteobacteria bacterium]|nr:type II secretion system protein GspN [Pseudomonadota bacterium]MDP2105009.1 type II secretion system protein GspN [Desulfobulbaceae bacterium]
METSAGWSARSFVKAMVYGLYFLAATAFFVWLRLPEATLKEAIERALHEQAPQFAWRVATVSVQLPVTGIFTGIEVFSSREHEPPAVVIDRLSVTPRFMSLLTGSYVVDYTANLLQGEVLGSVSLSEGSAAVVTVTGDHRDMKLSSGPRPMILLGREVSGTVSGSFRYQGRTDRLEGEGEISMALLSGGVSLTQPLFGMTQVDIDQSQFELVLQGTELTIAKGSFRSKDFMGEVLGTVSLATVLPESSLNLEGWCELFPSFFVNQRLTGGVQDFVKQRSKEGKIPFLLNGLVAVPQFSLK